MIFVNKSNRIDSGDIFCTVDHNLKGLDQSLVSFCFVASFVRFVRVNFKYKQVAFEGSYEKKKKIKKVKAELA